MRSNEVAILTDCVFALLNIQLAIVPTTSSPEYELCRAKLLSARVLLQQQEMVYDSQAGSEAAEELT